MKTLDEVIKVFEDCFGDGRIVISPLEVEPGYGADALYYLKEYHEHLKWQAYEEHCLAEEKKKIKQAYEQGYAQAKHDDEVARHWEESYRQSQMPWNHYTEMGG
ncbi:MAG: hypothetical protein IJI57_04695 [Flexilinea sp.]|nr:hypothetical protein [Flexilinea sp.]